MMQAPPTVIIRHRRENIKKCSLRGLEARSDFCFYTYPGVVECQLENYILLTMEGPALSERDKEGGLLLLDATWRLAKKMQVWTLNRWPNLTIRSLPMGYRTAYPRRQEDCPSPELGLASVEALYIAHHILGRSTDGILDYYYWRNAFLDRIKDIG